MPWWRGGGGGGARPRLGAAVFVVDAVQRRGSQESKGARKGRATANAESA